MSQLMSAYFHSLTCRHRGLKRHPSPVQLNWLVQAPIPLDWICNVHTCCCDSRLHWSSFCIGSILVSCMILGFHLWDHILVIWLTVCDTGIAPCVHIFFTAVRWSLTVSSCPSKLHIRHCEWKVKVSPKVGCPCKEITFLGHYALIDFSHQVKLQRTPLGVWMQQRQRHLAAQFWRITASIP